MHKMAQAATRPLSSSGPNNICKSVQFSRFIKVSFTYPEDEYDRTALEPAKLTSSEASELVQLRVNLREMNRRLLEEANTNGSSDMTSPLDFSCDHHHLLHTGAAPGASSNVPSSAAHLPMHAHAHLYQAKENVPCHA
ncbi:hypothetical protein DFQ27_000784 [Actinomortierella ambigua]|uniref:Uncharacterized protein n=1 Tax=Actinomortierella ambigua TaxID=1343610 RepID=A0A9P6QBY1_9FUNG|nr:hypothetical protein DFQ27_000784 [Actinomortierella ambigua]